MIHFLGTSFAAVHLKEGARRGGLDITEDINDASLIFVSEDTPTDAEGHRDTQPIKKLIDQAWNASLRPHAQPPIVLTSQVEPGFTRGLNIPIYHQAETLRIEDAMVRACFPEMFIVGTSAASYPLHRAYRDYLEAFDCPILTMTYEDAEFTKIAINAFLISQVETTNLLAKHAAKSGASWQRIAKALRHDSRIGKYAYLSPGEWSGSKHLLRDFVTLKGIEDHKLLKAWRKEKP